LRRK